MESMPEVSRGRLVGREAELGRLLTLLGEAAAGRPVVALVSGDAGVGKTRLVTELSVEARERGYAVLTGRCAELADTVPYLPLADALRDAAAGPLAGGLLLDALAARPVLGRLLPDVDGGRPPGGDMPGLAQQQLFGAVLGMLSELAAASPVLLVLEDLHWADRSTRDLVTFLSRALHRERLAIVVTYRTDDMYRRHPLRPVIAELTRLPSVTTVALGPLDDSAMADHLTALSGRPLDAAMLQSLITRAEGNAYYAEELLEASASGSELPAGLADLLLARTEKLSPEAQQVLRAAAVTGRRVDDELARQAAGLAGPEYDDAVREAVAHQLLVPDGEQGYAFRHALLREAIYGDLLPGERTRLHGRLAELLADERRLTGIPGTAAELAHHSLASHDIPGAFAASVAAGREAEKLAAPAEAHRHYDLALSLWERVEDPEKLSGMNRGKLAFRSALTAADDGDIPRAVQQLRRLISFLVEDGHEDPVLFSRASERLSYFLLDVDEDDAAIAAAEQAVDALPEDHPGWYRSRALATHARALLSREDEAPARARAEQALAAARAAGAIWVEADSLVTLGQLSEWDGRFDESVGLFTRALQQARSADMLGVELRATFALARAQLESGDLVAASRTAHEGVRRAEDAGVGLAPYGYDLQYVHYLAHYQAGEWPHAQELTDGFSTRVTTAAEARLSAMALFLDVARGDQPAVSERRTWLEPFFLTDHFTEYIGRGLLAEHALWHGQIEAAVAQAEATIGASEKWEAGRRLPNVIRPAAVGLCALADQAWQARAAGDTERASAAVQKAGHLMEIAREGAVHPSHPSWVLGVDGRGWLARAEAEWRRAQGDNDPDNWRAVVEAFGPVFVYETARSRYRLAEALAEAGRRAEAQRELLLAVEVADRIGAGPLRSALADLARRARLADRAAPAAAGGRGAQPGGAAARSPLAGLTDREIEVLRLLAAGQSNKEIGAELFIATKTASVHVSNILAKLGAASRTEAAAIAHAQGVGSAAPRSR
jgi:DNA-binding CsgD family transcriptional regulator/tetratricopeptide (TPR) repeat protein